MDVKASLGQVKQLKLSSFKGIGTPALVLAALAMIVLPIPRFYSTSYFPLTLL